MTRFQHELSSGTSVIPSAEHAVEKVLRKSAGLFPKSTAVNTAILLLGCRTEETAPTDPALTTACRIWIKKMSVKDYSADESRTGAMVVVN